MDESQNKDFSHEAGGLFVWLVENTLDTRGKSIRPSKEQCSGGFWQTTDLDSLHLYNTSPFACMDEQAVHFP